MGTRARSTPLVTPVHILYGCCCKLPLCRNINLCANLFPIAERLTFTRAERVVARNPTVRAERVPTPILAPRPRSTSSRGAKPKNFLLFLLRLPPHPPPRSGKFERKEIFGFAAAASLLQKGSYVYFSIFASFAPAFSPSFASARGAPVSAFCGSSVVRSHFATTSHWPLSASWRVAMPARCCFVFARRLRRRS